MKSHPAADLFPVMAPLEFEALKADIAANGQRDPVWTWRGQLIDGRHRERACNELGIACAAREWQGEEAGIVAFVISVNLHRRHLSESQRAMIAEGLANMRQGARTDLQPSANLPEVSQSEAASLLNVSERSVREAKRID